MSIAAMKEKLRILAGAHPMSPQVWERVRGLRRVVYDSADYVEGLKAFKEKRKPVYEAPQRDRDCCSLSESDLHLRKIASN